MTARRSPTNRVCLHCGLSMPSKMRPQAKYCSRSHRTLAYLERRLGAGGRRMRQIGGNPAILAGLPGPTGMAATA